MLKLIPTFPQSGTSWDHQGKSKISQIFITCSEYRIDSIQFAYVEDGGVVLSERVGRSEGYDTLKTINFAYRAEHITRVRGCYQTYYGGKRYLSRITFFTNKGKYGPYQPSKFGGDPGCDYGPSSDKYEVSNKEFNYEVGGEFYGFFGTCWSDGIESIGVYMNPLQVSGPTLGPLEASLGEGFGAN